MNWNISCRSTLQKILGFHFDYFKKSITNMGIETEIKKLEKENEDELPESAKMVYFPWDDVIGSMMEHHEEVHFCDEVCPDCGNRLINIEFWSPTSTWVALCGRSGPMTLCVHCPKQIGFSLRIMNQFSFNSDRKRKYIPLFYR